MRSSIAARAGAARLLGIMVVASLLSGLLPSRATALEPPAPGPKEPAQAAATPTAVELESWRKTILKTPRPKSGCFTATYPEKQWREVACKTPPHKLYPPKRETVERETVGGGGNRRLAAEVTGLISEAEGSFDSVTGVTSESANGTANSYSLQLNTNFFTTKTCKGSSFPPACRGWEQFAYSSAGNGFIQYWLIKYGSAGTSCPTPRGASCQPNQASSDGWCPFTDTVGGDVYCVVTAVQGAPAPSEPITSLSALKVTAAVAGVNGAANDSIVVWEGNTAYTASGNNYFPDLGSQWQEAEFNVFGDGGGDEAVFNTGSTIVVRTGVDSGTTSAPICDGQTFTGESNNLRLVPPCCPIGGTSPAIVFTESNAAGATSPCACRSVGKGCSGSGDCCSGRCIDGTCACGLQGSQCSDVNFCCEPADNVCLNGVCARRIPPALCRGVPTPRQPCTAPGNWHCCDDGWVCGLCR